MNKQEGKKRISYWKGLAIASGAFLILVGILMATGMLGRWLSLLS